MNKKTRKLTLSRETVRALNEGDLHAVQGAGLSDNPRMCSIASCPTQCTGLSDCCP